MQKLTTKFRSIPQDGIALVLYKLIKMNEKSAQKLFFDSFFDPELARLESVKNLLHVLPDDIQKKISEDERLFRLHRYPSLGDFAVTDKIISLLKPEFRNNQIILKDIRQRIDNIGTSSQFDKNYHEKALQYWSGSQAIELLKSLEPSSVGTIINGDYKRLKDLMYETYSYKENLSGKPPIARLSTHYSGENRNACIDLFNQLDNNTLNSMLSHRMIKMFLKNAMEETFWNLSEREKREYSDLQLLLHTPTPRQKSPRLG